MKKLAALLMLATALSAPSMAMARDVSIQTSLVQYSGHAAYLAVYLTNPDGSYNSTLWVSGHKTKYYGDLRGWARAVSRGGSLNLDGITGASVGSGDTLTVHANLADTLLDAGYQIRVDSAVENGGQYADDAVIDLTSTPATASGTGYVNTISLGL
ncbi:hypothetical protein VW29_02155 [Devosia limi DSM 17137]|uniref:Tat pathway signal protein n=1 Tax=Devosia limi DSM 17137 TaxID=1121477 RepID=A0A0F5LVN2_9HYPH|nr:DUF2271 domain-containing protein [Devosia limi]KKB86393.1 hypothetical protein VW29_02155 [Devosia limi DSM 17137]SHE90734.1 Hypothetical protein SAMN02745223_01392 [Devosia limi DSM 17137]